ncbi:hypothetical protein ACMGGR_01960 [Erwinia sp. BNK-24-b]|uniref:hypothetical protein n=1 Tax=unclassified Erwinia TaxID=2622719 RepID=UPI0039BFDACF
MNTNQSGMIAQGQFSASISIAEKNGNDADNAENFVTYHAATLVSRRIKYFRPARVGQ